ncbi:hypothetical protein BC829DRAFT_202367 [Chytridium lagenaria]|nr:hypothetical protein BC829DRAFT_202367 [Chytridium lagenaria]
MYILGISFFGHLVVFFLVSVEPLQYCVEHSCPPPHLSPLAPKTTTSRSIHLNKKRTYPQQFYLKKNKQQNRNTKRKNKPEKKTTISPKHTFATPSANKCEKKGKQNLFIKGKGEAQQYGTCENKKRVEKG